MIGITDRRNYNPLYWHLKPLLLDPNIRYIYVEGGSSASKTYTICQILIELLLQYNYSSYVLRRLHVDIKTTVYKSFKEAAKRLQLVSYLNFIQDCIRKDKTAEIVFDGLGDEENVKGLAGFKFIYINELSQFLELQNDQLRLRLRGEAMQKIIYDWNPISDQLWVYKNLIDIDTWIDLPLEIEDCPSKFNHLDAEYSFKRINAAGNAIWIKTTFRDNWWIVGRPDGKAGNRDIHTLANYEFDRIHKPNAYRIYANGERGIIRTGGEFWKQFNELLHVRPVAYNPDLPIYYSLDNNVNPYVTITIWQIFGKQITQIKEILCETPDNTSVKAARKLIEWLKSNGFNNMLYQHGDPTAHKKSTEEEDGKSFFQKFEETIGVVYYVDDKSGRSSPRVSLSAQFINCIYQFGYNGYTICIGDNCKVSINDYVSVQEDAVNGIMFKKKIPHPITKIPYEPIGHISDAKRYFICKLLEHEFKSYGNKNAGGFVSRG